MDKVEWRGEEESRLALTKETPWKEELTGECWAGMLWKGEVGLSTTRVVVVELVAGLGRMESGIWSLGRWRGCWGWLLSDLNVSCLQAIYYFFYSIYYCGWVEQVENKAKLSSTTVGGWVEQVENKAKLSSTSSWG